jgi:Predicted hydrolases or acyltransferases (alpha/beta hydrolase superfamily)
MHGDNDSEVPIAHGKLLARRAPNAFDPWWVEGAGHNDIDFKFRKPYFLRVSKFLKYVKDFNTSRSKKELEEFYKVPEWHHTASHIYFTMDSKKSNKSSKIVKNPQDYTSFATNTSLLQGSNQTTVGLKNNTESMITAGDQTNRKTGFETTRSAVPEEEGKDGVYLLIW